MVKNSTSAAGEKSAIKGYLSQYEFSACVIYRLMRENKLDGISICNESAGMLDDLVFFSGQKVVGHQVKSEKYAKTFTLRTQLLKNKLIKRIAESWQSLRNAYPEKEIWTRHIFAGFASVNDKLISDTTGGAVHSAAFLDFANDPDEKHSKKSLLQSKWAPFISELSKSSGLSEDDFFEMFLRLRVFDREILASNQLASLDRLHKQRAAEIKRLLPELVARRGSKTDWTETELVDELGWSSAASSRAYHSFPLTEDVQVNPAVEGELLSMIKDVTSGYVSLLGSPGTGKSTTLQRSIRSSAEYGVARYLAFVPDERHGLGRAESINFLNDITVGLSHLGYSSVRFGDEKELTTGFMQQLLEARTRFEETSNKTILVVDGLDHVQRDERPTDSFLSVLPLPNAIPDGVIIILGSQYLELDGLSPAIAQQASAEDRCVQMSPLPKIAVFDMAEQAGLPGYIDRELLYKLCAGHPLSARYYIERLANSPDATECNEILSDDGLGEDIEKMYERVWSALKPNKEATRVLALLARADNTISPTELAGIVNSDAVECVRVEAGFLIGGKNKAQWQIFHNSFRVFLKRKTGQQFGIEDTSIDEELNVDLANLARDVVPESGQRWLELRYRSRSGDSAAVKQIANAEIFRNQLRDFRPANDVYIDLRLSYSAIDDETELPKFVQLMLAEKEIDYRLEAISELDLVEINAFLDRQDQAFKIAISSSNRVDGSYELLDRLFTDGEVTKARQLFEAIEPVEHFYGQESQSIDNTQIHELVDWIRHAHRFRPIDDVRGIVNGITFDTTFHNNQREVLFYTFAGSVLRDDPLLDIDDLCSLLELSQKRNRQLCVEAARAAVNAGELDRARTLLKNLEGHADSIGQPLTRMCCRLALKLADENLAASFFGEIRISASPKFYEYEYRSSYEAMFEGVFSTGRLGDRLGQPVKFDADEDDDFQLRVLESILRLGRLYAKLEVSESPTNIHVADDLAKICMFWALSEAPKARHHSQVYFGAGLRWFARAIVRVARKHSLGAVLDLETKVEQLYRRGANRLSHSSYFRLTFAVEVYAVTGDRQKAQSRISYLEDLVQSEHTPHQAVELRIDAARALTQIGAMNEANNQVLLMHQDTLGYWLAAKKEPQYVFWNYCFEKACQRHPDKAGRYGRTLGRFVAGLAESEGDDTGRRIAYGLLQHSAIAPADCSAIISTIRDTHLLSWGEIVASVLHGISTERKDLAEICFYLLNRLVIPFSGGYATNCINPIYSQMSEVDQTLAESDFIECTKKYADTSGKVAVLSELIEDSTNRSPELERALSDSKKDLDEIRGEHSRGATEDAVNVGGEFDSANSLNDLISVGDGKSNYGDHVDYSYAAKAAELVASADKAEIENFLVSRPHLERDAKFTASATARMLDLGAKKEAMELYVIAERAASKGSWSRWLGGEKIRFEELRLKVEGEEAKNRSFRSLVYDFANGRASASMVMPDLDTVFNLVASSVDWEKVWDEVQAHLQEYREFRSAAAITPRSGVSSEEDLIGVLFELGIPLSCHVLTDRLREGLTAIGSAPNGAILFDRVATILFQSSDCHLELASSMWRQADNEALDKTITKFARLLADSDDIVVSSISRNILAKQGVSFNIESRELPKTYSLGVIGDETAKLFESPGGVGPDSSFWIDDPWYWTRFLKWEINTLSDASGVAVEAIRRRCAQFMSEDGGAEKFGPPAETVLLNRLKSLGLKFNYARLMPLASIRALRKVVGELAEAGLLDPAVIQLLWSQIGGPSFCNHNLPLQVRPPYIIGPTLPTERSWKIDENEWLALGPENSTIPITADWVIIAEHTSYCLNGGWQSCTMIRTTMPSAEWNSDPDDNLFGLPRFFSLDDLSRVITEVSGSILCTITDQMFGDLREPTLTLNPTTIKKLGWKRATTNPLEIFSPSGEIVFKTIRWIDGIGAPDPTYKESSSHGQVVLVSKAEMPLFYEHIEEIALRTRVIQEMKSEGTSANRMFIDGIVAV